jgi:hypothetical protein
MDAVDFCGSFTALLLEGLPAEQAVVTSRVAALRAAAAARW